MTAVKRSDISDREALEACWGFGEPSRPGGLSVLVGRGYPQKVAEAKLEQLVDRGWLDYGVSVGCPWRTPVGEASLAALLVAEAREVTDGC
jgi:hypothetical protein